MRSEYIALCEAADIIVGFAFPSEGFNTDGKGIRLVRGKNITKGTLRWGSDTRWWNDCSIDLSRYYLQENDIVVGMDGSLVGKNYAQIATRDLPLLLVQRVACVRAKKGYDQSFIWKCISSTNFEKYIDAIRTGTSIPHVSGKQIGNYLIPNYSYSTQKKIGSILKTIDDKIELNNRINDNMFEIGSAWYASLFGNSEHQATTVGRYSKQIYSGGTPSTSRPEYWNGSLHWLSSGETRNRFAITTDKTITNAGVDNSSTKLAHKYDIVMASAGQGFTRGQTTMLLLDTYVNQSVIVIHADRLYLPYLFWNLANRYEELRAISDSSSIRGSLTTKMIAGFKIAEVSPEALQEFSNIAWAVLPEIEKNLLENENLTALRDALLPKLMSGELDVSEVEL